MHGGIQWEWGYTPHKTGNWNRELDNPVLESEIRLMNISEGSPARHFSHSEVNECNLCTPRPRQPNLSFPCTGHWMVASQPLIQRMFFIISRPWDDTTEKPVNEHKMNIPWTSNVDISCRGKTREKHELSHLQRGWSALLPGHQGSIATSGLARNRWTIWS